VAVVLREQQERASALLAFHVDARSAKSLAKLVGRVLADDVETALPAGETAADIRNGSGKLLVTVRIERADVIALLVLNAR
jgi:hypothetical protein